MIDDAVSMGPRDCVWAGKFGFQSQSSCSFSGLFIQRLHAFYNYAVTTVFSFLLSGPTYYPISRGSEGPTRTLLSCLAECRTAGATIKLLKHRATSSRRKFGGSSVDWVRPVSDVRLDDVAEQ